MAKWLSVIHFENLLPGLLIAGGLALLVIIVQLNAFFKQLRYINMELQRSHGKERERWQRIRRHHIMSLIPFYREK